MVEEKNLAFDEANRLARHEAVKDTVRREAQERSQIMPSNYREMSKSCQLGAKLKSLSIK